ncbi:MAG: hypothetical protein ACK5P5_01835, partial [Pseudobdellovibrionaceae bacterium]
FNNKLSAVAGSSLTSGQVWIGNGSNQAVARNFNISDLRSTVSGSWFTASGACASGQALTYSSVTDTVSCQAYTLTSSQVTTALGYTPANPTNYVAKTGDTMTGTLNLASNGLTVGTNQFVVSGGNVGIGTTAPAYSLDLIKSSGANVHVSGSGSDTGSFLNVNAGSVVRWGANASFDTGSWISKTITNQSIIEMGSSNFTIYHNANPTVGAYVPSPRLTINSTGNVGIGTTIPSAKLDVNGSIRFGGRTTNRVTVCSFSGTPSESITNRFYRYWVSSDCDNGLPQGSCIGALSKTNHCGGDQDWEVVYPGEDPGSAGGVATNGGMAWWTSTPCGNAKIRATYWCDN